MISIQNLGFSYQKKKVFQDLNLDLKSGQICGLFGKNGVGKTTFLHLITGLLFPKNGEIDIMGYAPKKREVKFLREIFFIHDEVYLPNTSISKYEKLTALFYPKFNSKQFNNYLKDFEVDNSSNLNELSFGQRKKVFIAFGLATNTSLVLMDEPTNGLDIVAKSQFKKMMATLMSDERCFIISTHQAKDLENLIDRVMILDDEKMLFNQSIESISKNLLFKISNSAEEKKNAFYSEDNLYGSALVLPNKEDKESSVDLELLYKTIINNSESVNNWFNNKSEIL